MCILYPLWSAMYGTLLHQTWGSWTICTFHRKLGLWDLDQVLCSYVLVDAGLSKRSCQHDLGFLMHPGIDCVDNFLLLAAIMLNFNPIFFWLWVNWGVNCEHNIAGLVRGLVWVWNCCHGSMIIFCEVLYQNSLQISTLATTGFWGTQYETFIGISWGPHIRHVCLYVWSYVQMKTHVGCMFIHSSSKVASTSIFTQLHYK